MQPILAALTAWRLWRTPSAVLAELRAGGADKIEVGWDGLDEAQQAELLGLSRELETAGADALLWSEPRYPDALSVLRSPPPILMTVGNLELLDLPAVGVCGSRSASDAGLGAARVLAEAVAAQSGAVVAGNALGVDAEAQGAALAAGGSVISVLPEGITHFRLRTGSQDLEIVDERLLVISQFPPRQPWSVGGAMTRNELIVALTSALVVIEAGERGGTLAAGEAGLKRGRKVVALEFGTGTPKGNEILIARGAIAARTQGELRGMVGEAMASPRAGSVASAQMHMAL